MTLFAPDGPSQANRSSESFFGGATATHSGQCPRLFDTACSRMCDFKNLNLILNYIK